MGRTASLVHRSNGQNLQTRFGCPAVRSVSAPRTPFVQARVADGVTTYIAIVMYRTRRMSSTASTSEAALRFPEVRAVPPTGG
jgi:hypothetical protein